MKVKRTDGEGKKTLDTLIAEAKRYEGKIGWLESSKYPDGMSVAHIATIQEFGDPPRGIPPRPMLRPVIAEKRSEWRAIIKRKLVQVLQGDGSIRDVMEVTVLKASGDVRKQIASIKDPPLKKATVKARMRQRADKKTKGLLDKPLVDTGVLLATCTGVVEDKLK